MGNERKKSREPDGLSCFKRAAFRHARWSPDGRHLASGTREPYFASPSGVRQGKSFSTLACRLAETSATTLGCGKPFEEPVELAAGCRALPAPFGENGQS